MNIAVIVIILIAIIFCAYPRQGSEEFTNRDMKSRAIVEWFSVNNDRTYKKFRKDTGLTIVDYEIARKMNENNRLSAAALQNQL